MADQRGERKDAVEYRYDSRYQRHRGFHEYYQINGKTEHDEADSESDGAGELKATGLNSLWGMIYMIAEKTGWSYRFIMWGITWINLKMMLADAPAMKRVKNKVKTIEGDELAKIMGL